MYIIYKGKSNQYLTKGQKYYSHYYGIDDEGTQFYCIRDNQNQNHIITQDYKLV